MPRRGTANWRHSILTADVLHCFRLQETGRACKASSVTCAVIFGIVNLFRVVDASRGSTRQSQKEILPKETYRWLAPLEEIQQSPQQHDVANITSIVTKQLRPGKC
jgi:hypothetical protein